jgi:hypothetical protein
MTNVNQRQVRLIALRFAVLGQMHRLQIFEKSGSTLLATLIEQTTVVGRGLICLLQF